MPFGVRNTTWSGVDAELVSATTGGAFGGTVTCYVNGDNTGQVLGGNGAGVCASVGNGVFSYVPLVAETNFVKIAFTFVGAGAIPQTVTIPTVSAGINAAVQTATSSVSISVTRIIQLALRRINVIQSGQTFIDPGLTTDAFSYLNMMLDDWESERLTKPFINVTYANLVPTKGTPANPYTVGVGGDFNIKRPTEIHHMNYQDNAQTPPLERPLTPLTRDAYIAIPLKQLTSPLPGSYFYNPTYAGALGSLFLWMIPTQGNLQGVLYTLATIAQFATLQDVVILPPAYQGAMVDNLAVLLGSIFRENIPLDPTLIESAARSKANLKRVNNELMDMSVDPALTLRRGVYNIFSDGVVGKL